MNQFLKTTVALIITILTLTAGCKLDISPVTVTPVAVRVTGVSLNKSATTMLVSSLEQLYATIEPANAANQNLSWDTSNVSAVTVDSNGLLYADSTDNGGVSTVTVTTEDGGFTAECVVTVTEDPIPVTGVSLNKSATTITEGNTEQLTVIFEPSNATNQSVTWSSGTGSNAAVSASGVVTAVNAGFADIIVETEDGGFTDTCTVTVLPLVIVTGVSLDKTNIYIDVGSTEQLTETVNPFDATNKNVTWSTTDGTIATVSSDGLVTAVAGGTAWITVTTEDGGETATCKVGTNWVAGNKVLFSAGKFKPSFNMVYVPGGNFPTGSDDSGSATVSNPYWIGETEVTYQLWSAVYDWAVANEYQFEWPGGMGGGSSDETNQHPVTSACWRDYMVWCNAATEWYNANKGSSYSCVYKYAGEIIRDSSDYPVPATACDNAEADANATGFRLLYSAEWELAARWRNNSTNTVSGYTDPYFTKGDSTSGAYTFARDIDDINPANGVVDAKDANDLVAVYEQYYIGYVSGTPTWEHTGVIGTAAVKSKAANSLGLFDMSGNVEEWCFNLSGSYRVFRGGSWSDLAPSLGRVVSTLPESRDSERGFRLAMNK